MANFLLLGSSPSDNSRGSIVLAVVAERLQALGHDWELVEIRELSGDALLHARCDDAGVQRATKAVVNADAIVLTTPVYKASYSGVLKIFLDLLPQGALRGKAVLPIVTGGTLAHFLSIDYALRPVLRALSADRVLAGRFILDTDIVASGPRGGTINADAYATLMAQVEALAAPFTPTSRVEAAAS